MKSIDRSRNDALSVGVRVSRLFFVLTDLTNVDPMYQYSLDFFKHIFAMTLNHVQSEHNNGNFDKGKKEAKKAFWIKEFTKRLYSNISRSLFQRHIPLFSLLLCLKIMDEVKMTNDKGEYMSDKEGLNLSELRFLMAGAT